MDNSYEFLEEDECKAALSSPIKGGKRLSSSVSYTWFIHILSNQLIYQAIIKLEHTTPPTKRVTAGRKEKYTNVHLLSGCQDYGAWCRIFIPTYLQFLASWDSDDDTWTINDDEGVSIQQKIWDFVYGNKVPHIITVQGPVFALISILILQVPTINLITLGWSTCLWMAQWICFCCPVHCQRFLRQQQVQFWRRPSKFCKGCFGVICISLPWCLNCQGWWGKDSL